MFSTLGAIGFSVMLFAGASTFFSSAASGPEVVQSIGICNQEERPDCRYCDGKGEYDCNMCDATGMRTCSFCGGEGTVTNSNGDVETCANCNGKKEFECGYCDKGKRKCTACNGTGKVRYIGE